MSAGDIAERPVCNYMDSILSTNGQNRESEWKVLQSRLINNIPDFQQQKIKKSAVKLSFSKCRLITKKLLC